MTDQSLDDDRQAFERILNDWERRHPFISAGARHRVTGAFRAFLRTLADAGSSSSLSAPELNVSDGKQESGPPSPAEQPVAENFVAGFHLEQVCLDTLSVICRRLVETFGFPLVWVGQQAGDEHVDILAVAGSHAETFSARFGSRWYVSSLEKSAIGRAICTGTAQSIGKDCEEEKILWLIAARSGLVTPLAVREHALGVLMVCSGETDLQRSDIVHWLEMVAAQTSVIVLILQHGKQLALQGAAIASTDHAVCITNDRGIIQWINTAFSRLTGYPVQAVIDTPLSRYWPVELADQWTLVSRAVHRGKRWAMEFVHAREDGTAYAVEQVMTPLVNHYGYVTHFVVVCQDVTTRKKEQAEMVYLAHHDPLTRLPNRILFQDRLIQAMAQARRLERYVAVLFLDLDHFKCVNDECGHAVGDELLKTVGSRLCQCVRATDTVARRSGDEFTLLLQGIEQPDDAEVVARKILACLAEPFHVNDRTVSVRTSLGIALFPLDATDPDSLIRLADRAMYHAKQNGGHCWCFASDVKREFDHSS